MADSKTSPKDDATPSLARVGAHDLLETLPDATLIVGRTGKIALASAMAEPLFGYGRDEMQGELVEQLLPKRFRRRHVGQRRRYVENPCVRRMDTGMELYARHKDGHEFPVDISISPLQMEGKLFVVCSVRDVSQLKHLTAQLQSVGGRLILAQEEERKRIAREIHDDVNQRLALVCVELDLLGRSLPYSAVETREKTEQIGTQVRQISSELHDMSHELHPSKLEHIGLVPALRSLCNDVAKRSGRRIAFFYRSAPAPLDSQVSLCLYRIVQEALANMVKHSGSKDARVELVGHAAAIRLLVADSGAGFDPDLAAADGGLGMIGMSDRVRLVGGEISIESEPARGTRIEVRVPLEPPAG